jgi:hypothetical protein
MLTHLETPINVMILHCHQCSNTRIQKEDKYRHDDKATPECRCFSFSHHFTDENKSDNALRTKISSIRSKLWILMSYRVSFFCLGSSGSESRLDKLSMMTIVCNDANCFLTSGVSALILS